MLNHLTNPGVPSVPILMNVSIIHTMAQVRVFSIIVLFPPPWLLPHTSPLTCLPAIRSQRSRVYLHKSKLDHVIPLLKILKRLLMAFRVKTKS